MSRQERLHNALSAQLKPNHLVIENETHQHSVPRDAESHFKICIVSELFKPMSRISRHRFVNQIVQAEFEKGLHALSLHLYSPTEWAEKVIPLQASPACKGGSRVNGK